MAWVNLKKGKNMFFVFCVGGGRLLIFFTKNRNLHIFLRGGGVVYGRGSMARG